MKKMTCKQLGGACDLEFEANTFDEIAKLSQMHGKEMLNKGDQAHIIAMKEMKNLISSENALNDWMQKKRNEFENITDS